MITGAHSLLMKIVVRGRDLREATQRAARTLRETGRRDDEEAGVKTNEGVVAHADWEGGKCDTTRLQRERELGDVINTGTEALKPRMGVLGLQKQQDAEAVVVTTTLVSASRLLPKEPGAKVDIVLSLPGSKSAPDAKYRTLTLASIVHNSPIHNSATLQTIFSSSLASSLKQVQSSAGVSGGAFDFVDPNDNTHVLAPLDGTVVQRFWLSGVAKSDTIA